MPDNGLGNIYFGFVLFCNHCNPRVRVVKVLKLNGIVSLSVSFVQHWIIGDN